YGLSGLLGYVDSILGWPRRATPTKRPQTKNRPMIQTSTPPKVNKRELRGVESVSVERLANSDAAEVLEFLARRSIHTIAMMGLIHDNGIISPFNRGTFYGCRDCNGQLEG